MNEIIYLIYILTFIAGSVAGLLFSYRQHGEPFVRSNINVPLLLMAILGWVLVVNTSLNRLHLFDTSIGFFLIAFVLGMRPGYGRYETVIGILFSIAIYTIKHLLL
ncbi:MAG: DUF2104 domain-containing protein [Methanobrevibacter sp.]|jgi:energy-converting hydrogenase A subunit L|nr:DUF2104 domain-containing protein [Candidatus Methanovirga aequatorialis]